MSYDYFENRHRPMKDEAYWAELRRKANDNLANPLRTKKPEAKERKPELQSASADEIQSGFIVLESRRVRKELNRLLRKKDLKGPELEYAEELQSLMDDYDATLEPYNRRELTRFVRLWNKSQKGKR